MKKVPKDRLSISIEKYGYVYTLIETDRNGSHQQPCFMGHKNFALFDVKKVKK